MTTPNKLKARAVSKIRKDWIAGASIYDLAAEHDVTHAAIRYHVRGLEREEAPRMGRPRSFDHDRAATLVKQGFSLGETAERFGVTKPAISQALAQIEVETGSKAFSKDEIVWVWNTTALSASAIGRQHGVSKNVVLGIVHRDPRAKARKRLTSEQMKDRRIKALEAEVKRLQELEASTYRRAA